MKILYITGMGRSGSSLLAQALGSVPAAANLGEFRYLWDFGLLQGEACPCGRPVHECEFWGSVLRQAFGGDTPDAAKLAVAHAGFDHLRRLYFGRGFEDVAPAYREAMARLLKAAAEQSGAEVLVDASKSPVFAAFLQQTLGVELRLLHLVRDARAVAHSSQAIKTNSASGRRLVQASPLASSLRWNALNAASERLLRRQGAAGMRLRYEDFVRQPEKMLDDVLAFASLPPAPEGFWGRDEQGRAQFMPTRQHAIGGNPGLLHETEPVSIQPDQRWRQGPATSNALVTALTWPWLLRYGYLGGGA